MSFENGSPAMNGLMQGVLAQESTWLEGESTYSIPASQSGPLSSEPITSPKHPESEVLASINDTRAICAAEVPLMKTGRQSAISHFARGGTINVVR